MIVPPVAVRVMAPLPPASILIPCCPVFVTVTSPLLVTNMAPVRSVRTQTPWFNESMAPLCVTVVIEARSCLTSMPS